MQFEWSEIVSRFRSYIDDDHDETKGWLDPTNRLGLVKVEYRQLYRKWVRSGLINVEPVDVEFTGPSSSAINGVLAIIGVAEKIGDCYRPLESSLRPCFCIFRSLDAPAALWEAFGEGDNLTVKLTPADTRGTYVVRYIPVPTMPTALTDTVELPYMGDERIALGAAKRAGIKEMGGNRTIDEFIYAADQELTQEAAHRHKGSLKMRDVRSTPRNWLNRPSYTWTFY